MTALLHTDHGVAIADIYDGTRHAGTLTGREERVRECLADRGIEIVSAKPERLEKSHTEEAP